jgi:hypothetical protein
MEKALKDDFYSKTMADMNVILGKQVAHAKKDKNPEVIDQPCAVLYNEAVRLGIDSDIKNLQKHLKVRIFTNTICS